MEHFGTDSIIFPIWPNGLAQTLLAIKRSPLIPSKGLDGFTVSLQTADGAGRVHCRRYRWRVPPVARPGAVGCVHSGYGYPDTGLALGRRRCPPEPVARLIKDSPTRQDLRAIPALC